MRSAVASSLVVVAREETGARRVDQLADGLVGVGQGAVLVEAGDGALADECPGCRSPRPESLCPREPFGVPGSRVMMTAFSVEPKPSHTSVSNRRPNSSMSRSLASLPNATRSGLSASSGSFGSGQDVSQRLADVVHVRRAVASDVVQEPRRRELRREPSPRRSRSPRPSPPPTHWNGRAASTGSSVSSARDVELLRPGSHPTSAP